MPLALYMKKQDTSYAKTLFLYFIGMFLIVGFTSFYLINHYYAKSLFSYNSSGKDVYFVQSQTLRDMYDVNKLDYQSYEDKIAEFKKFAKEQGFYPKDIYADDLDSIDKNSIIVVLDMMALSQKETEDIDQFVKNGGKILFNFTSGFLDDKLHFTKNNLVTKITGLSLDKEIKSIKFSRDTRGYLSTRMLSPLTKYLKEGRGLDLTLYDPLPIFNNDKNIATDGYLTNWSQANYINISADKELNKQQSGLLWHGYHGKGKWVYFSFPSYVFLDGSKYYLKLLNGIFDFLDNDISVNIFPYLHTRNIVFISEDTEYKYENLEQFYKVAQDNRYPLTAFCVARLALKHQKLMNTVAKSKYLELGSHSFSHGKIVGQSEKIYEKETISSKKALMKVPNQPIYGFRPPREEIDDKLISLLEKGNFKYILNKGDNRLAPYFIGNIVNIPRHGTDDYSYLIELDWDSNQILNKMKVEVGVVTGLDGIYTLSVHTHLLCYGSNIRILDKFVKYVKSQKNLHPMNGKMIYNIIEKKSHLSYTIKETRSNIVLEISNDNAVNVNDVHFQIAVDSGIKIKGVSSEVVGVRSSVKKIDENSYELVIHSLKPKSKIVLFVNYEKN